MSVRSLQEANGISREKTHQSRELVFVECNAKFDIFFQFLRKIMQAF